MENNLRLSLLLISFLLLGEAYSKVSSSKVSLVKNVRKQKHIVESLAKEMSQLENGLGKGNKRYLRVIKNRQKLEERIFLSKVSVKENESELNQRFKTVKKRLMSSVLNSLKDEHTPAEMFTQKVLLKSLKKEINELSGVIKINQNLVVRMQDLEERFQDYISVENELVRLLNQMEREKEEIASNYRVEKGKEKELSKKYAQTQKVKQRNKKLKSKKKKRKYAKRIPRTVIPKISLRFQSPLKNYKKFDYHKKGITFYFKERRPLYPTAKGKILHVGSMSNYGNVIIIKHDKSTHSVLFGKFIPKVRNGSQVNLNEVIGYTDTSSSNELTGEKVYFEVRQKDQPQNTISLMKKDWLAKNNLTRSQL